MYIETSYYDFILAFEEDEIKNNSNKLLAVVNKYNLYLNINLEEIRVKISNQDFKNIVRDIENIGIEVLSTDPEELNTNELYKFLNIVKKLGPSKERNNMIRKRICDIYIKYFINKRIHNL